MKPDRAGPGQTGRSSSVPDCPARMRGLDAFVEYYNNDRPHLGIKGLTSLSCLAALSTTL